MSHVANPRPAPAFRPVPIPQSALNRYPSPEAMAKALGTSRYPQRGLTCADWTVQS